MQGRENKAECNMEVLVYEETKASAFQLFLIRKYTSIYKCFAYEYFFQTNYACNQRLEYILYSRRQNPQDHSNLMRKIWKYMKHIAYMNPLYLLVEADQQDMDKHRGCGGSKGQLEPNL